MFNELFRDCNDMIESIENEAKLTLQDQPATMLTIENPKFSGSARKKKNQTTEYSLTQNVAINNKAPQHDFFISPSTSTENDSDQCMYYNYLKIM